MKPVSQILKRTAGSDASLIERT